MSIDFFCSEPQYLHHLAPVYLALPEASRGKFLVPAKLAAAAKAAGVDATAYADAAELRTHLRGSKQKPTAVAAYGDLDTIHWFRDRVAFFEHGAGFSYGGHPRSAYHQSFAGSPHRPGVTLFVVPGPHPAQRNRAAFPRTPIVEVGCPKLDARHLAPPKPRGEPPVVALTWHWEGKVAPETRSAWPHYRRALAPLAADKSIRLLGHFHPRAAKSEIALAYDLLGIEVARDLDDVFDRADVLVADSTSATYEFASLGRPVVLLNAPWYRRDVEHGLRFWSAAHVGPQVDEPEQLLPAIRKALRNSPKQQRDREDAVRMVYTYTDGRASERAAEALVEWAHGRLTDPTIAEAA